MSSTTGNKTVKHGNDNRSKYIVMIYGEGNFNEIEAGAVVRLKEINALFDKLVSEDDGWKMYEEDDGNIYIINNHIYNGVLYGYTKLKFVPIPEVAFWEKLRYDFAKWAQGYEFIAVTTSKPKPIGMLPELVGRFASPSTINKELKSPSLAIGVFKEYEEALYYFGYVDDNYYAVADNPYSTGGAEIEYTVNGDLFTIEHKYTERVGAEHYWVSDKLTFVGYNLKEAIEHLLNELHQYEEDDFILEARDFTNRLLNKVNNNKRITKNDLNKLEKLLYELAEAEDDED